MKIYIVEESINKMGGVERIINLLSNYLNEKYKVIVVSLYKQYDEPFFKYDNKIQIDYLSNSVPKNKLIRKLKEEQKIIKYCKNIKPNDVIIFGRVSIATKFLPFIKKGAKIIVRDAINIYCLSKIVKIIMKMFFHKKVNAFVVSSNESYNDYKRFFGKKNINIIKQYNPLGIEPGNSTYSFETKTILSSGRFEKQKGFENLIYAFEKVHYNYPDWTLKIYGDGELKKQYLEIIKQRGLEKCVFLEPPQKNVVSFLNQSSIYVMTSRYEGYANALVEALACGIPSVSYNWLTGSEEIIDDKNNGRIVYLKDRIEYYKGINNEEDVTNLANCLIELISNKELLEKYSKNAKKIMESRNPITILKKWNEIIIQIID